MNTADELVNVYLHPECLLNNRIEDGRHETLDSLKKICLKCNACQLGRNKVRGQMDPHLFSNMQCYSKFILIGASPGINDLETGQPLSGPTGRNFDIEIRKNGHSRAEFYICNTVRCFMDGNVEPDIECIGKCDSYLRTEIEIMKPKLVVSLGVASFNRLCPGNTYSEKLGHITKSSKYNINVFAIYHPSPRNLENANRQLQFSRQIKLLCGLIEKL